MSRRPGLPSRRLPGPHARGLLAALLILAGGAGMAARAQSYPTMASEPDPRDFVRRSESQLTMLGKVFRFGGVNITWLGARRDGTAAARRPTRYEVADALETVQALGAPVIRLPGLADTAGCALCLEPAPGQFSDTAFAQIDLVLATARDLGLKVILPLADSGRDCAGQAASGVICVADGGPGATDGRAFFTDARLTAAFLDRVRLLLNHRNRVTGALYRDDPTILAWESCDGCGLTVPDEALSAWTEGLGRTIKAVDTRHLYESGSFAGRIGRGAPHPVAVGLVDTPSVDIVGDTLAVSGDPQAARLVLDQVASDVAKPGRAFVLDSFGWSPALWKTTADLESWLASVARTRQVSGAVLANLQSHSDQGGYLPAAPASGPGMASLYFPGAATADMDLPTMQERGRSLRRFFFAMSDITETPTYLLPPKPEVVSAVHGRVVWRGAAGAATYSIERSADPGLPFSWTVLCDACTTDAAGFWQDPQPAADAWYRVMPLNINGHKAEPSEPFQGK